MTLNVCKPCRSSTLAQVSLRVNVSCKFYDNHVLNALRNKCKKRHQIYGISQARHTPLSMCMWQGYVQAQDFTCVRLLGTAQWIEIQCRSVGPRCNSATRNLGRLTVEVPRLHTTRHEKQVGFPWASVQLFAEAVPYTKKYSQRDLHLWFRYVGGFVRQVDDVTAQPFQRTVTPARATP